MVNENKKLPGQRIVLHSLVLNEKAKC